MVTLDEENGRGNIGLIAVGRNYRGKEYGQKLVRASQRWFISHEYNHGQVVTQRQNLPACNLFSKCGYSIEKVEYFYHFWL
jgi:dTDP-4-amino-4,6-dideoxy-D-galactose acyltransferase